MASNAKYLKYDATILEMKEQNVLPFPEEILVKIFSCLEPKDICACAQVSKQFYKISEDQSVWKSWNKVSIDDKKVSTKFIAGLLMKGIEHLDLFGCEILPNGFEKIKTQNLKLKSLNIQSCSGGEGKFFSRLMSLCQLEHFSVESVLSTKTVAKFIENLPQTGRTLNCLIIWGHDELDLSRIGSKKIRLIAKNCPNLELYPMTLTTY